MYVVSLDCIVLNVTGLDGQSVLTDTSTSIILYIYYVADLNMFILFLMLRLHYFRNEPVRTNYSIRNALDDRA